MDTNLLKFIWKYSRKQQLIVVAATMLSFPILYLTLELPKIIINDALSGVSAQKDIFGWQLSPVAFLASLCFSLLGLVILSGVIKMRLNTYKGILGERLIRRLRYTLMQNVLRFPLPYFSRISSGELISTVTAETEPLSGYIGESIAMPLFQGGTMITILIFMFAQDWTLGLISVALIPVQGYLIPKLQQQVNALKKNRVLQIRKLSEQIGETVAGSTEIRLHGTQPYTLAGYSRRLGDLFMVRMEIFKKKYFMKFLNNTISQITPFMFYLFGGYLVIKGDLTVGALVAAIGAYKELTNPWRELLNYYQLHEDSKIKYQQIVELFNPENLVDVDEVETVDEAVPLKGKLSLKSVSWRDESGTSVLSGISLEIPAGSTVAITGEFAARRAKLALVLTGIEKPSSGSIQIDDQTMAEVPDSILRRRVALQGPVPHMFVGTISENLEYGLQQHEPDHQGEGVIKSDLTEAFAAGNRAPLDTGWLDYRQAGEPARDRSPQWLQRVINAIGSASVVAERRLFEVFEPKEKPDLAAKLLTARKEIRKRLVQMPEASFVAHFDSARFNSNASILENILFGVATDYRLDNESCEVHPYLHELIEKQGLTPRATLVGLQVGRHLLNAIDNNALSHLEFEHFRLSREGQVEQIKSLLDAHKSGTELTQTDRCLLMSLFLRVIPERHTFIHLSDRARRRVVQARHDFQEHLPVELDNAVNHFHESSYHPNLTVKDNLLFGRVSSGNPTASRAIDPLIAEVIEDLGLDEPLLILLGESQVGISGSRLPLVAKHRLSLGRSLMKKPSLLIFHDALSLFDSEEKQSLLASVRELLPESTIIWISSEIDNPADFDNVYTFTEAGPLISADSIARSSNSRPAQDLEELQSTDPLDLIANSTLFADLSPAHQRHIADHSRLVTFPANTRIYEMGDNPDSAWLVVSGEVETTQPKIRGSAVIGTFRRPEVFGSLDVMADSPRVMNADTSEVSDLLRIDASAIESVALSDANVSRTLLRSLSKQWRR
ncbi:hypothetical protein AB833_21375 [Chromatiales bacterium (ex Bugula neritina AB1)]|nr:hypothetical protein AB833_21375 [Chromatiales bacterium (ex Bugula neritina AB1)]